MSFVYLLAQYFFEPLPSGVFRFVWLWGGVTLIIFLLAGATALYVRKNKEDKIFKKLFKKVPYHLLTLGICFGLYLLSRYEHVPFFSMRVLEYILLACTLWIIVKNTQIYLKEYPQAKKRREEQLKLNQYLPRKHARR